MGAPRTIFILNATASLRFIPASRCGINTNDSFQSEQRTRSVSPPAASFLARTASDESEVGCSRGEGLVGVGRGDVGGESCGRREREVFVLFHIAADDQTLKSKL